MAIAIGGRPTDCDDQQFSHLIRFEREAVGTLCGMDVLLRSCFSPVGRQFDACSTLDARLLVSCLSITFWCLQILCRPLECLKNIVGIVCGDSSACCQYAENRRF